MHTHPTDYSAAGADIKASIDIALDNISEVLHNILKRRFSQAHNKNPRFGNFNFLWDYPKCFAAGPMRLPDALSSIGTTSCVLDQIPDILAAFHMLYLMYTF